MSEQPWEALVEYERPPVVETALAVRFRDSPRLSDVGVFDFWNEFLRKGEDHPLTEVQTQPFYEMPLESFGGQGPLTPQLRVNSGPPLVRYWFRTENGDDAVQIQKNFMAVNWRKRQDAPYSRYDFRRKYFENTWDLLNGFVKDDGGQALLPAQCEIVYINHIYVDGDNWSNLEEVGHVVSTLSLSTSLPMVKLDGFNSGLTFTVDDDSGKPFARLHVQFDSAVDARLDNSQLLIMTLTFRGRPFSSDKEGVLRFFDSGHNWIVGTFDSLTTDAMHQSWRRKARVDA